ncbi:excalibur calcium-binding domain-containing protein [Nocardioides flavescens]|uniref:Excalibur calcium-binding domain-containing protein n=1 Tax=Nocardioides flavescens TaxID=2691959 RepID=A0A6L7F2T1_9ACTN|nr:excalibur calcium-binding domain-containing protein [Nocardioides flavescens]MXG91562.1 hypothetical protein [Nocardioides flavescens]
MRNLVRLLTLMLAATGLTFVALAGSTTSAQAKDLNCDDFSSQAAAQANLNNNPSDPNGLDTDGDGVACESNPCPCNTSSNSGGNNNPPAAPSKKFHAINLRVAEVKRSGNSVVIGKVPTYRGKFQIQRKLKGQNFKLFKRATAKNPTGAVKIGVTGPKGTCFKAIVPATKKYKATGKVIGCIR